MKWAARIDYANLDRGVVLSFGPEETRLSGTTPTLEYEQAKNFATRLGVDFNHLIHEYVARVDSTARALTSV